MRDMKHLSARTLGLAAMVALSPVAVAAQKEAARGWVGVLITTGVGEANSSGNIVFRDYPVIESIDPGSPAERAGLRTGDVLLSINSQDFKLNPIPMDELLIPGRRITFRYRRDNVDKVSKMIVAERPAGTSPGREIVIRGIPDLRSAVARREAEREMTVRVRSRIPVDGPGAIVPLIFGNGTTSIAIAGAELTQLNEGLRKLLKFKGSGVLVINVPSSSPAAMSGLESGDVIVRANKVSVENPGTLITLITEATLNSINQLPLQVVRNQKQRNIVLRW
jgi:serine protease Do